MYSISLNKPLPIDMIRRFYGNYFKPYEFTIDKVTIYTLLYEKNENFLRQISFFVESDLDKIQRYVNDFLIFLKRNKINPDDVIWSYETYFEIDEKVKVKLNLPSNLPLIGSVTNLGIIVTNDPDLQMRNRNFTSVQVDRSGIKVIKRADKYIIIPQIIDELEKLITILNDSFKL